MTTPSSDSTLVQRNSPMTDDVSIAIDTDQTASSIGNGGSHSPLASTSGVTPGTKANGNGGQFKGSPDGDHDDSDPLAMGTVRRHVSADEPLFGEKRPPPARLDARGLNYDVVVGVDQNAETKRILKNINFTAKPGELIAVMGPSGSGKTTLMNIMGGRNINQENVSGRVLLNGGEIDKKAKRKMAYVLQDDIMLPNLSVRETLEITALLRLPKSMTRAQKLDRVSRILSVLGLARVENSIVGNAFMRGVSGGERKRVNIGNELLMNPSLLLLDEPTSGLDSFTASLIVQTLRELAAEGRAVLCSIHQPSSQLFTQFDKLLLLANGNVVYFGPVDKAVAHCESLGLVCPAAYSWPDFLLEMCSPDAAKEGSSTHTLVEAWKRHVETDSSLLELPRPGHAYVKQSSVMLAQAIGAVASEESDEGEEDARGKNPNDDSIDLARSTAGTTGKAQASSGSWLARLATPSSKWPTTFGEQFSILLRRAYLQRRGHSDNKLNRLQMLVIGLIVGLLWFQTENTEKALQDRLGVLFFIPVLTSFNTLFNSMMLFPPERAVLQKERNSGSYRLSAYFLSRTVSEIPFELGPPSIFIFVSYWLVGLNTNFGHFLVFYLLSLTAAEAAGSLGLLIGTAVHEMKKMMVWASIMMIGTMLIGGFYVESDNIPPFIRWIQYLSFVRYAFYGAVQNELVGASFSCLDKQSQFDCPSGTISGDEIVRLSGFDELSVGENFAVLLGMTLVLRVCAYVFLRRDR